MGIEVYGRSNHFETNLVKCMLNTGGYRFTPRDADTDKVELSERLEKAGSLDLDDGGTILLPQIFANGKLVGTLEDVLTAHENGTLQQMIGGR